MKIRKIKWNEHPILGNLQLEFLNEKNEAYDTILFAGENGSGKTSILESITNFLIEQVTNHIDFIEYETKNETILAKVVGSNPSSIQTPNLSLEKIEKENIQIEDEQEIKNINPYQFGCVYSKARATFKTSQIQNVKLAKLDISNSSLDENEDFTDYKQLLADIDNVDNNDYSNINKTLGSNPKPWEEFYLTSRSFRFKNAFDTFFETIEFQGVEEINTAKELVFNKNGKTILLDKLSTGEKQIIFRGTHLLRNMKKLTGSIILIDEPELSMHPKWQRKIMKYFKDIVSESGKQKSQIFFSTHSEQVLKQAFINDKENLPIILFDESGVISSKKITSLSVLPSITSAEINYLAFDMVSNDYHIELYGWIQENQGFDSVKKCDDFILNHSEFKKAIHGKISVHPKGKPTYNCLSTYIRNLIDHPKSGVNFSEEELRISIDVTRK